VKDLYQWGMAEMNLATLYHDQGDYARAGNTYQEIFAMEETEERPLLACKLRHNWVNLLFHEGKTREAENTCYEWLRLSLKYRYPDQQAFALNYLGLLSGREGRHETQLGFFNRALRLLDSTRLTSLYFQILLNRGSCHLDLRKFTAAQLDGEAALRWAERHSGQEVSHLALLLLGRVLRDRTRPDWEGAAIYFNRAHQIIWEKKIHSLLWEVEFERGLLAKKKKERDRAKNYFLSAQKELEAFLQELPESTRKSYLRDQKWERISTELESLQRERDP
jgi:tetratricopeptide (TPR) repeat protein